MIGKKILYVTGSDREEFHAVILDKFEKTDSWSTGIGHAFGPSSYYLIESHLGDISYIRPTDIVKIIEE